MQKIFAILITIFVFAFFIWGAFTLHNDNVSGALKSCLIVLVRGTDCSNSVGVLQHISFHLDALKDLAAGGISATAIFLIAILFTLAFIGLFIAKIIAIKNPQEFLLILHLFQEFISPLFKKLSAWISLHENSPSILIRGA